MENKVAAAVFIFLSVGPGDHAKYNRYSSYDHMPEFQVLPGQVHAQRYVATPELITARSPADPSMAAAQYFIGYYHAGPADATLKERATQNQWLIENAPIFEGRRDLQFVGAFDFKNSHAAHRSPISAEALPYRPHTGIFVTVSDVYDPRHTQTVTEWYDRVHIPRMLTVKGFLGTWCFTSRQHPDFPVPEGRILNIYFLDEEPVLALSELKNMMASWPEMESPVDKQRSSLRFESAFRTIIDTPSAKYDWFD